MSFAPTELFAPEETPSLPPCPSLHLILCGGLVALFYAVHNAAPPGLMLTHCVPCFQAQARAAAGWQRPVGRVHRALPQQAVLHPLRPTHLPLWCGLHQQALPRAQGPPSGGLPDGEQGPWCAADTAAGKGPVCRGVRGRGACCLSACSTCFVGLACVGWSRHVEAEQPSVGCAGYCSLQVLVTDHRCCETYSSHQPRAPSQFMPHHSAASICNDVHAFAPIVQACVALSWTHWLHCAGD